MSKTYQNSADFSNLLERFNAKVSEYHQQDMRVFASSSFQTQSVVLLHMISRLDFSVPIFFINTGFHFPETLVFRDKLVAELKLDLHEIRPAVPKSEQRNQRGELLYTSDPDRCCEFNKVQPLASTLRNYDVWISGVRRDQTSVRRQMREEEKGSEGILRYHPMLDWDEKMIEAYIELFSLPRHPLAPEIKTSIGCEPCTWLPGEQNPKNHQSRSTRWQGLNKTECGLHTELGRESS